MSVEESVHIIFDETNFLAKEHDINNFKMGLANLEDDEEEMKVQDQGTAGEQPIQEAERSDHDQELPVHQDQQTVPNAAVPTNQQVDPEEVELNNNQANDPEPTTVPTREFVPKP